MARRTESLLRSLGYLILLLAFLALAINVKAQYEVNREARLQKWTLISMELVDVNSASNDWNNAVKRYKSLDDINQYELLNSVRQAQVANARIEAYLMALDEPTGYPAKEVAVKEFRCTCGVLVITNDPKRTECLTCETQRHAQAPLVEPVGEEVIFDRFSDF